MFVGVSENISVEFLGAGFTGMNTASGCIPLNLNYLWHNS